MTCKYRCMKCGYEWETEKPGSVTCPTCGHVYVDWMNFKEVLKWLKRKEITK